VFTTYREVITTTGYPATTAPSLCKHLLKHPEDLRKCRGSEPPQTTYQTLVIYRANLVENNVSGSSP